MPGHHFPLTAHAGSGRAPTPRPKTMRLSCSWLATNGLWVSVVPRDDRPEGFLLNGARLSSRMVEVTFTIAMLAERSER